MKNIPELRQIFLKCFPSFKSFNDSGQEYLDSEDTYKRKTSSYLHQLFDDWISSGSDSLSPEEFKNRLKRLFSDKLPGIDENQNLIQWRDQDVLYDDILNTEVKTRAFMAQLHALLISASVGGEVDERLQKLLAWLKENDCPASLTKAIPTFFLCFWNPQQHIFIKPRVFDGFLKSIGEKHLGSGKFLTVDEYHRVLTIMQTLRLELAEWAPRDMIDLQSFYFMTQDTLNKAKSKAGLIEEPISGYAPETSSTQERKDMDLPLNLIIYGPPGTGKTYALRNEYMTRFTELQMMTRDQFAQELAGELTWLQVITIILYDLKSAKVPTIFEHPLLQAKFRLQVNRNPKNTIWSWLQQHAKIDCPNVKNAQRKEPLIFWKDEDSVWTVDHDMVEDQLPELIEKLQMFRKFKPDAKEIKRYEYVTFHQSYCYEDFVEGIKPMMSEEATDTLSYEVTPGIFKNMAAKALNDPNHKYALLIDEINRGNVASVFGELIALIEEDKRKGRPNELKAKLPYSREEFVVPDNLYIIGAMNTADRSVEALDTALRRRFTFVALYPQPEQLQQPAGFDVDLRKLLITINGRIEKLLDKDHCIGHSYFMAIEEKSDPLEELRLIFKRKILPLLEEYFYGDPGKIGMVLGKAFVTRKDETIKWAAGDWGSEDYDERLVYAVNDPLSLKIEDFRSVYEE